MRSVACPGISRKVGICEGALSRSQGRLRIHDAMGERGPACLGAYRVVMT